MRSCSGGHGCSEVDACGDVGGSGVWQDDAQILGDRFANSHVINEGPGRCAAIFAEEQFDVCCIGSTAIRELNSEVCGESSANGFVQTNDTINRYIFLNFAADFEANDIQETVLHLPGHFGLLPGSQYLPRR